MAIFAQTFDANTVEPSNFDVFPAGKYLAQIVSSEMRPTKDGRGQYLFLELDILEGPFAGRKLFDRLNLVNDNPDTVDIANHSRDPAHIKVFTTRASFTGGQFIDITLHWFKPIAIVIQVMVDIVYCSG